MRAAFLGPFLLENAAMAFFNFPQSPSRLAPCMPGTPSPRSWCQNYPRVRITALSIMACSVQCLAAATAASTLAATDLPAGFDAPTYAIYKPRGVLSITGADEASAKKVPRRTLTDLMVSAGLKPLPGHVGRLDLETGGLILVTGDGLLLEAALAVPFAVSLQANSSFKPLPKTYMLLLAGRHLADTAAIEGLRAPLTHRRGGKEYNSDGATVRVVRCFQSEELATEYALLDDDDVDVGGRREAIRAKRNQTVRSRKTGELVKPFVPSDGWLTEMEVTIRQGRHHQIRRLCQRAGLELRHLRRTSFGPIELGLMQPGEVRVLGLEEKAKLYGACVPHLEGAHARRLEAMAAARDAEPSLRRGTR